MRKGVVDHQMIDVLMRDAGIEGLGASKPRRRDPIAGKRSSPAIER
jgi:hypothetical protein